MKGEKILITGATGQVGLPAALALAKTNEVWAAARFSDPATRVRLTEGGVKCVQVDLESTDMSAIPTDFSAIVNGAVARTNRWPEDLEGNVGGLGRLMHHCKTVKAFLHVSTTAVYKEVPHHPYVETDSLGDNHGVMAHRETYSIAKIAAEAMAQFFAREFQIPTTIARLNVPYGANGGMPRRHLLNILAGDPILVHVDHPNVFNPLHERDIVAMIPRLLGVASVPATIVNWGGSDPVSLEDYAAFLGDLVGKKPVWAETEKIIRGVQIDTTRMHKLIGPASVPWQDGFRDMVAAVKVPA